MAAIYVAQVNHSDSNIPNRYFLEIWNVQFGKVLPDPVIKLIKIYATKICTPRNLIHVRYLLQF